MALNLSQSIDQRQRQELHLSARQLQSLHILQETAGELSQEIHNVIIQNPMLEVVAYPLATTESGTLNEIQLPGDGATTQDYDLQDYREKLLTDSTENRSGDDFQKDLVNLYDERRRRDSAPTGENHNDTEAEERRRFRLESSVAPVTMPQMLADQVRDEVGNDPVYEYIVFSLHDNGYLHETPEEIAAACEVSVAEAEEKLHHFKEFIEPAGIGAASLRECLLLQLQRKNLYGSIEWEMIEQHFELLAARKYRQIAAEMELDEDEILDAAARIKEELYPEPAILLETPPARTVLPDVFLFKNRQGEWEAETNRNLFPTLELNALYKSFLEDKKSDAETKKYIRSKQVEAQTLIDAIDYRFLTIEKIALALTYLQPDFFSSGRQEDLRPLTQSALAASLEYAESTVSRAMQDKYVATPWGTLPFRIFFPSAIQGEDGNAVSSSKIRRRIREIIQAEDKRHPISDEDISALLAKEGFTVKRRTVAKYRDLENIPSTSARRQR